MSIPKLFGKLFKRRSRKQTGDDKATARVTPIPAALLTASLHQFSQNLDPHPQSTSLFFSLPGEIRNRIYFYASYPSLQTITIFTNPITVFSPQVFHICRRMRIEAISQLYASKIICLYSFRTAISFLEIARNELSSLRHVTIRFGSVWRADTEDEENEKRKLLDCLKLATGLIKLVGIIGWIPSDPIDEADLKDPESPGVRFLYAVQDVVDGEGCNVQEEKSMRQEFLALCEETSDMQAVQLMREGLEKKHEGREEKVFRLCVLGRRHEPEITKLPLRIPKYLRRTQSSSESSGLDEWNARI